MSNNNEFDVIQTNTNQPDCCQFFISRLTIINVSTFNFKILNLFVSELTSTSRKIEQWINYKTLLKQTFNGDSLAITNTMVMVTIEEI